MRKTIVIAFFFLCLSYITFSQSVNNNLLLKDTVITSENDSLLKPLQTIKDTIILNGSNEKLLENTDLIIGYDTLKFAKDSLKNKHIEDSVLKVESLDSLYTRYHRFISDSLIFEDADSVYFVINQLEKELFDKSNFVNDTVSRALQKLFEYRKNINATLAIDYLKKSIEQNRIFKETDSAKVVYNDSLLQSIMYIINSLPEDSLLLYFTNTELDLMQFSSGENEVDSIHFMLYDNRGVGGLVWVKKIDKNLFKLELEDDVYLEKIKQRSKIHKGIDTEIEFPELKKMERVNLVVPIWKFGGTADIKFNQGHISPTWAEGGESSLSLLSILKYNVNYTYGKRRNFDFDFEYRLGYLKAGENDLQKNDDKLELNFKYGRSAFNNWFYSGLLNVKTQILKGYEYVNDTTVVAISEFFSPASVVFSLGLDYKPSKKLTILISPLTSKFTIVADTANYDQTRFGLASDERIRKELGAYIKAISKIKILDNVIIENKVNFFTNYVDNPQNIDIDWETDIAVRLTDYIKISVNAHLIYDDDVAFVDNGVEKGPRVQFKELFGIGFTYMF